MKKVSTLLREILLGISLCCCTLATSQGITLNKNGTSQNYVDSDGTITWNQSENNPFNFNVTGIGRDDASELNQKQSKTTNTNDDITIGIKYIATTNSLNTATFFADKTFLMWGNNNGSLSSTTKIIKDFSRGIANLTSHVSVTPIARKWKLIVIDSVPAIKLSIPKSMVASTNSTNDEQYVMIIADDAAFTTNVTSATMKATNTKLEVDFYIEGTKYITFGSTQEINLEARAVTFDRTDKYLSAGNVNDLANTNYTISAWIKKDIGTGKFDIVSKRNYFNKNTDSETNTYIEATYSHGYAFEINKTNQFRMVWRDPEDTTNNSIETSAKIPENEWHQITVTYDLATNMTRLYIDGHEENSDDSLNPMQTPSDAHFMIGAAHHIKRQQKYGGSVDEVRVWDVALTGNQIRYIMNQEIEKNNILGTDYVDGKILPINTTKNEIISMPWDNLIAYYPMNTLVFGSIKDESNSGNDASMINYNLLDKQTAPLPYKTTQDGNWDDKTTWANGDVQYLPGTNSFLNPLKTIDYNIVQIDHNVTMDNSNTSLISTDKNENRTLLGLYVSSEANLQIDGNTATNSGNSITVSHYLKLDGTIDLEGKSQLIQTDKSDLDPASFGTLERDLQGNSNTYSYNYWCSPVGINNNTTNNNSYTLPDIITNVGFLSSGQNGSTSPIKNADYWIWKFANKLGDTYSKWQHVRSTGTLETGQGFTMKGPGTATPNQNYILQGKPNNGDFSLIMGPGNEYLVGNPYPSAMDANKFIKDNIANGDNNFTNVINGALYFRDHFANNTHILGEYDGGYAVYTLMGGTKAIFNDIRMNTSGQPENKEPERYIPIGQGFFVSSIAHVSLVKDSNNSKTTQPINGGSILFKNSQRVFKKESISESSSFKNNSKTKSSNNDKNQDTRQKIRLMYDSPDGYHRQLLVGVDEHASNNFDIGYDALIAENNKEDMYWVFNNAKLIIQAVNNFNDEQILPLAVKTNKAGLATIKIDYLENIDSNLDILIHDKALNTYHNLNNGDYNVHLQKGEFLNRFEITFSGSQLQDSLNVDDIENNELHAYFSNEKESVVIYNPSSKNITSVALYNILGQSIFNLDKSTNESYIEYKTKGVKTGTYILRVETEKGKISKKVLVN